MATAAGHAAASLAFVVAATAIYFIVPWWMRISRQVNMILRLSTNRNPLITRILRIACIAFIVVGLVNLVVALVQMT